MQPNDYQILAARTLSKALSDENALAMGAIGLAGEISETVELIYYMVYHASALDVDKFMAELGDVAWYASAIATITGFPLSEILGPSVQAFQLRYSKWGLNNQLSPVPFLNHEAIKLTATLQRVSEPIKKYLYHGRMYNVWDIQNGLREIFAILVNLSALFNVPFISVLETNLTKLEKRHPQGFKREDAVPGQAV